MNYETLNVLAVCATIAGFLLEVGKVLYSIAKGRKTRHPDVWGGDKPASE